MRLIDQYYCFDVPYENTALETRFYEYMGKVVYDIYGSNNGISFKLGRYTTSKKADKVLEMVRKQYADLQATKTTFNLNVAHSYMTRSVIDTYIDKVEKLEVFKFPSDEEVKA